MNRTLILVTFAVIVVVWSVYLGMLLRDGMVVAQARRVVESEGSL